MVGSSCEVVIVGVVEVGTFFAGLDIWVYMVLAT